MQIIDHHVVEADGGRLIETEAFFQLLDQGRVQALGAAVLAVSVTGGLGLHALAAGSAGARGDVGTHAAVLGHDPLNRAAGRELDDNEVDQQDPEQRRDHQ